MALVSVEYEYEYKTRSGRLVSIKPNERYVLVSKSNEHWWHVRRDQHTQPFYVPAQYVKELSAQRCPGSDESGSAERVAKATHVIRASDSRETHRFSTFGLCVSLPDAAARESLKPKQTLSKTENSSRWFSVPAAGLKTESRRRSNPRPADQPREKQPETAKQDEPTEQTPLGDGDVDFPLPPPPPPQTCCAVPEINITEFDSFPEPPDFVGPDESASKQQQQEESLDQTAGTTLKTENQVQNESLHTAVYVNVAQLRQSLSESPPSDPSPCSPSYLSQEGWEVHVDQESGQEYYYHPVTGRTTWDNPFSDSPTDPKHLPAEEPCFPSPLQSPVLSTSPASRLSSDWEQLVDETSGRPYFYNPTSGETSWEPPEQQSPYPLLMEPMSVHRFHDDGPPPLPEEDYPPEDYPGADQTDSYEDLNAAGPPTLPKEYAFTHVSRTLIPRANLDRTTPPGWNLTVEPNGTWVFTNENSPDQWIKSMDEQGQSYYYLRDGSRSQWNLPEAPVGPSHFGLENDDDEAENVPVIKNWRDSKGSVQFSSTQDDGRFVPTHTRNTSDYSSDSSSTGNSPETQHFAVGFRPWRNPYYLTSRWLRYNVKLKNSPLSFHPIDMLTKCPHLLSLLGVKASRSLFNMAVPNLEKAGILNKTKVCEKGKKVKKNWTPTWTVLRGGVLTFHKDPKSTGGAVNKTNQIVPEISVELKGATINKATKDKSSKKNVLELKGKNGVEFLLQNDTESIIADWLKILVDTIRQLEYQEHHSEDEEENAYEKIGNPERDDKAEKRKSYKPPITPSPSNAGETDPKKVRTKLMKLLMKRPTLQSVKDKGYIRETVFGCHLVDLCAQENTTVPSFVDKCIKAVEKRGLDIDGLYRVSGNLAVIQKLRFKADHEELDLEDGQWEDVHVITGALKLFFRELPDPLFPFSHFNKFVAAIRITDYKTKLSHVRDLVKSLPPSNHDTMKLLFGHLQRVIDCGENNRMTVQNVAIVFGPTLLRPEMESANITMHMVFQNQIVEFILNEYDQIFHFG